MDFSRSSDFWWAGLLLALAILLGFSIWLTGYQSGFCAGKGMTPVRIGYSYQCVKLENLNEIK